MIRKKQNLNKGFIYILNQTDSFNVRAAVSIYTLRKFTDLPITVMVSKEGIEHDQIKAVCNQFNCTFSLIPDDTKKRRAHSLLLKTRTNEWTPYEYTIFLDADTHLENDITQLFDLAAKHGFVVTEMGDPPWLLCGGKVSKRIKPWIDHKLFDPPNMNEKSINSGVFCFKKDHPIFSEWYDKTAKGIELFGGAFYCDEYTLNLLALKYKALFVPSKYNAYGKYHKDPSKIVCYHHAGAKHFRATWVKNDEIIVPSSKCWVREFDEARSNYPELFDKLSPDKNTIAYMKWKDNMKNKQPQLPVQNTGFIPSKLAPTLAELEWMLKEFPKYPSNNVLEFGCGITTKFTNDALHPKFYLAIEDFEDYAKNNIESVKKFVPNVELSNTWEAIKGHVFDFIFVDSSAGCGKKKGLYRDATIAFCIDNNCVHANTVIAIHDLNKRSGKGPKALLEKRGWKLVGFTNFGTGVGIYKKPQPLQAIVKIDTTSIPNSHQLPKEELDGEQDQKLFPEAMFKRNPKIVGYHKNYKDITVVTAGDERFVNKLYHTVPNWIKLKGMTCPIIIFMHNIPLEDKRLNPFKQYPNVKVIPWEMKCAETQRERMLAAFVLGAATHVKTPYMVKFDSETVALNDDPWLKDEFFEYDMVGQKWGYTKPAHFVSKIDYWMDGLQKIGKISNFKGILPLKKYGILSGDIDRNKFGCPRVCSWIRLCKTSLIQNIANNLMFGRLPMPSEDTLVWRWCERLGLKWGRHNFKGFGWVHSKNLYAEVSKMAMDRLNNP